MTEDTALRADLLGMRYGGRRGGRALRECDFALPRGRICALVGPNGAGKSTLLALAALAGYAAFRVLRARHP